MGLWLFLPVPVLLLVMLVGHFRVVGRRRIFISIQTRRRLRHQMRRMRVPQALKQQRVTRRVPLVWERRNPKACKVYIKAMCGGRQQWHGRALIEDYERSCNTLGNESEKNLCWHVFDDLLLQKPRHEFILTNYLSSSTKPAFFPNRLKPSSFLPITTT